MLDIKSINTFVGRKKLIKHASLTVKSGDIVGLIGPNGAGKTTIMKTILGLMKFTGEILLDNRSVTENNHAMLSEVGALIEHPAIYPFLSGFQNLKLYSHSDQDLKQVVERLEMDSYIQKKSKNYSLGMKQKLGIAIALLNHPKLVVLDEPMNGLDIEATILVRKIIKEYAANGSSFLISSHVLGELQKVMTDVVIINNGEIIVNKPMNDFYSNKVTKMKLRFDDMKDLPKVLEQQNISFQIEGEYLIIDYSSLYAVEDLISNKKVRLLELSPIKENFEDLVVGLLQNQGGDSDA